MKSIVIFFFILLITGFCYSQSTAPLNFSLADKNAKTNLTKYLDAKKWNLLFPHRYGKWLKYPATKDFYSFKAFVTAAKAFPFFLADSNEQTQKRELAAFLANIAQETSGGWPEAPGGYFKWGLYFLEETHDSTIIPYTDTTKIKANYMPFPGKFYFGRGPKQLSWNYNYGQFSQAWYGSKDTLLQNPELLSKDAVVSFASAIWFWMTPQFPKPSCHDIIIGKWKPNANDSTKGRMPGFGSVVNVINGGVECGSNKNLDKTMFRYQYYQYFCKYFNVSPGDNISCANQIPFGQ
jgi:hypothetical protein